MSIQLLSLHAVDDVRQSVGRGVEIRVVDLLQVSDRWRPFCSESFMTGGVIIEPAGIKADNDLQPGDTLSGSDDTIR